MEYITRGDDKMLNELIYQPLIITLFFIFNCLNIFIGNKIVINLVKKENL